MCHPRVADKGLPKALPCPVVARALFSDEPRPHPAVLAALAARVKQLEARVAELIAENERLREAREVLDVRAVQEDV